MVLEISEFELQGVEFELNLWVEGGCFAFFDLLVDSIGVLRREESDDLLFVLFEDDLAGSHALGEWDRIALTFWMSLVVACIYCSVSSTYFLLILM